MRSFINVFALLAVAVSAQDMNDISAQVEKPDVTETDEGYASDLDDLDADAAGDMKLPELSRDDCPLEQCSAGLTRLPKVVNGKLVHKSFGGCDDSFKSFMDTSENAAGPGMSTDSCCEKRELCFYTTGATKEVCEVIFEECIEEKEPGNESAKTETSIGYILMESLGDKCAKFEQVQNEASECVDTSDAKRIAEIEAAYENLGLKFDAADFNSAANVRAMVEAVAGAKAFDVVVRKQEETLMGLLSSQMGGMEGMDDLEGMDEGMDDLDDL